MMRRLIGLGFGLGLGLFPTISLAAFSDVSADHRNADAIAYAQENGIVQGYADGTFKPEKIISRSEFTKIIVASALGYDPAKDASASEGDLVFNDLVAGEWYLPYIRKAVQAFIVSGYPDGTFRPHQTINFAEGAKIVVRAFGIEAHQDDVWYRPYVQALDVRSAIPQSIGAFDAPLTRGEMAEIVYRLKANIQNKPSRSYDEMAGVSDPDPKPSKSVYADFTADAISGRKAVLFFYASWCPECRAQDIELQRWYASEDFALSTYKVDYATESALKARYNVTYQHTFVLVDAIGNALRVVEAPNDAELIELLMSE